MYVTETTFAWIATMNGAGGVEISVQIDGEPWFVGRDVAEALGYKNTADAIGKHVDSDDKLTSQIAIAGQRRDVVIIDESGLYSLIFSSKLPSAKKFKRWVTSEVLPVIRKTGSYTVNAKPDSYQIEDPVERAKRWIEEQEEKKQLENQVAEMKPKSDYFDAICDSRLLTNFRDAAKELEMSQSQFTGYLKSNKYIYATSKGELRPMEAYRASDLFQMKSYTNPCNGYSGVRTYLTPKGIQYFRMILETQAIIPGALPKHGGRKVTTNRRKSCSQN